MDSVMLGSLFLFFFFKQKTAYEMRISDWSSDVCSSDLYLVASAQAGSREALDQLVRRWQPRLAAHALRLTGERDLAMDAVQLAWGAIVKGIARLEDQIGRAHV